VFDLFPTLGMPGQEKPDKKQVADSPEPEKSAKPSRKARLPEEVETS
jgi:hypothetical protein